MVLLYIVVDPSDVLQVPNFHHLVKGKGELHTLGDFAHWIRFYQPSREDFVEGPSNSLLDDDHH